MGKHNWWKNYLETKINLKYIVICGVIFGIVAVFNDGNVDICSARYGNLLLYYLGAITGIGIIFELAKDIDNMVYIKDIVIFWGINSMEYMAIHQQMVIHPLNSYGIKLDNSISDFLMRFFLALLVSTIIIFGLNKINVKKKSA